jgi:hypothetical protein
VRGAAQDPGVEGRLAVEPLGDMEVAVHAQPPRPLVPAPGASLFAPHGLSSWLAALPSSTVRARLARSAFASPPPSTATARPRRRVYLACGRVYQNGKVRAQRNIWVWFGFDLSRFICRSGSRSCAGHAGGHVAPGPEKSSGPSPWHGSRLQRDEKQRQS